MENKEKKELYTAEEMADFNIYCKQNGVERGTLQELNAINSWTIDRIANRHNGVMSGLVVFAVIVVFATIIGVMIVI